MGKLKKIIIHWSASSWTPNAHDLECYHQLITGNGKVQFGKYKPEDNINCKDGKYAAHCGGGNTGSIGIALCAMHGYINPRNIGAYPIRMIQLESLYNAIALDCKKYHIDITPETVMTHYEFGKKHPDTSSAGKIDITFLPTHPELKPDDIGDFIRDKAKWYLLKV